MSNTLSFNRESASCTHISGILYALVVLYLESTAKADEGTSHPVPITSLECQWSKPRRRKDSKVAVSNVAFKKHING